MTSKPKTLATKVPKLRFPEFRGAGEWEETRLGRMGVLVSGLTYSPDDVRESGLLVLRSANVQNGEIALDDCVYVDPAIKGANLSHPNDILICVRNGSKTLIGKCALIPERMPLCTHGAFMTVFRAQTPSFVFQLFQSDRYQKQVVGDLGATINSINGSQLLKYEFFVPKLPEQQKIAECLSSVDELMAAQARKVDALKTHKKGLMQQLFPREGETEPRLRFPEFRDAGEWEVKRVDEQGNVLAGKALAVNAPGPLRPYLRTKNVLDGAIELSDVLTMPMTDAEFSRFEILDGDVLLNEGQSLELVGRAAIYRGEFGGRCAMQNQLLRFRAFPSTCPEFAAQYFRKCQTDGTFAGVATKTTSVAHLGSSRFSALELAWPSTLTEQQRIAACLSSLDALIAAETRKLEALKIHKRGLMQQLFPSLEEGTA